MDSGDLTWRSARRILAAGGSEDAPQDDLTRMHEGLDAFHAACNAVLLRLPGSHAVTAGLSGFIAAMEPLKDAALAGDEADFDERDTAHSEAYSAFLVEAQKVVGSQLPAAR